MSITSNSRDQTRFFGLNLGSLWRDLLAAWASMLEWRVFSWAWPEQAVRVRLPVGGHALSRGLRAPLLNDEQGIRSARFEALLLPEELLLRRTLNLPKLQPAELQAALTLEVQALSPFATNDLAWAWEMGAQKGNFTRVQVVLSSHKLIEKYKKSIHPDFELRFSEVWVSKLEESGFILLPGFGEVRRPRQVITWRWASALLILLAIALVTAMAATPSIKLYLRALQANQAFNVMSQKTSPAMAQRESLVRLSEQLTSLTILAAKSVPPLQTLKLITQALPDDTSLLSLQLQGHKVSITGQTANAASLMKQLGSTPGLHDVRAPTPATKPMGAPRESFTIEFTLDPAQLKAAS